MSFLQNLIRKNKIKQAKAYQTEFVSGLDVNKSLFIHSKTTGSGKTFQALQFVKKWFVEVGATEIEENDLAVFCELSELREKFHDWVLTRKSELKEEIDNIINTPLLVLDDVGAEFGEKSGFEIFAKVVIERYNAEKQTIFTSNLSLGELGQKYNSRLTDRIIEMCGKDGIIQAPEKDFRQSELARPNTLQNSTFYQQRMAKIEAEKRAEQEKLEQEKLKNDPDYQAKVKEQFATFKSKLQQKNQAWKMQDQVKIEIQTKSQIDQEALKAEMEKNRQEMMEKLQIGT